jgi:hypothetical protein
LNSCCKSCRNNNHRMTMTITTGIQKSPLAILHYGCSRKRRKGNPCKTVYEAKSTMEYYSPRMPSERRLHSSIPYCESTSYELVGRCRQSRPCRDLRTWDPFHQEKPASHVTIACNSSNEYYHPARQSTSTG